MPFKIDSLFMSPVYIMQRKVNSLKKNLVFFRDITSTHKAIILTFITPLGVELNAYAGIVQKQILLDELFR